MSCEIIFWESLTDTKNIFYIWKKIVRIMAGAKREVSCREIFKKFNILPLSSEYLTWMLSLFCKQRNISNKLKCTPYTYKTDFALMCNILTSVNIKKGVHYFGIRLFSNVQCWHWTFNTYRWDHLKMLGTNHPAMRYPVPEEWRPQLHCCKSLNIHNSLTVFDNGKFWFTMKMCNQNMVLFFL